CGDLNFLATQKYSQVWPQSVKVSLDDTSSAFCLLEEVTTLIKYFYSTATGEISSSKPVVCPEPPYSYP
ncbi:MAG: hypothetical protein Q8Q91_01360, partial [Candidatus Daviesbacteria bacterium]|nr:hypothetical protein [Candidatus Daviesbacteria bacterium]